MASRTLAGSVRASVRAMHWVTDADQALVDLVMIYARELDEAADVSTVRMVGPKLLDALRALGGTPADRAAIGVDVTVRGKLAELRAARERRGA